jgi:hypothetical protein
MIVDGDRPERVELGGATAEREPRLGARESGPIRE